MLRIIVNDFVNLKRRGKMGIVFRETSPVRGTRLLLHQDSMPGCGAGTNLSVKEGFKIHPKLFEGSKTLDYFISLGRKAQPANILIIEDDNNVRLFFHAYIATLIRNDDQRGEIKLIDLNIMTTAENIANYVTEKGFDCVVMDERLSVRLPDGLHVNSGVKITELLRQKKYNGWIIANSGDANKKLLAAGADIASFEKAGLKKLFQI